MKIVYTRDDQSTRHIVLFRKETLCGKVAYSEAGPALPASCDECRTQNGKVIKARRAEQQSNKHTPVAHLAADSALVRNLPLDMRQDTPQSGYTPCACRDCMETIVAKNQARPELCDDCHTAGCGDPDATTWPECQRDDAYGEC